MLSALNVEFSLFLWLSSKCNYSLHPSPAHLPSCTTERSASPHTHTHAGTAIPEVGGPETPKTADWQDPGGGPKQLSEMRVVLFSWLVLACEGRGVSRPTATLGYGIPCISGQQVLTGVCEGKRD
jgi:hypothetical protein